MNKRSLLPLFVVALVAMGFLACAKAPEEKKIPKVGPVKINPHPASLEGKTVLLRWNGKYNGDILLNRVAELLNKQVKDVKIIKVWEVDSDTASISKSLEVSERITKRIVEFKPDIVIATQCD